MQSGLGCTGCLTVFVAMATIGQAERVTNTAQIHKRLLHVYLFESDVSDSLVSTPLRCFHSVLNLLFDCLIKEKK